MMLPGMLLKTMEEGGATPSRKISNAPSVLPNVLEARFCPACGHQILKVNKCLQCGKDLPLEANFCMVCGTKVEMSELTCAKCGAKALPGATFCNHCGEKL